MSFKKQHNLKIFYIYFLAILLGTIPGMSQDNGIDADRPDFTESASLVPVPFWQFEFGYTYEKSGKTTNHYVGELLVRKSLNERVEFRLTVPSYRVFKIPGFRRSGFEDLELGVKLSLQPDRFALLLSSTIPTGNNQFRSRKLQPSAKLAFAQDLGSTLALGVNLGYSRLFIAAAFIDEFSASLSLQIKINRKLGAFLEYYGFFYNVEDFTANHYVNGGIVIQLATILLADVRLGSILKQGVEDYFFGIGGVLRF